VESVLTKCPLIRVSLYFAVMLLPRYVSFGACFLGEPFLKRFALCYRTVVCPVCLSCLWRWCIVAKRLEGLGCHLVWR